MLPANFQHRALVPVPVPVPVPGFSHSPGLFSGTGTGTGTGTVLQLGSHIPGTGTVLQLGSHIQMKPQAPHHFIPTQHPKQHTIRNDQNPAIATRQ